MQYVLSLPPMMNNCCTNIGKKIEKTGLVIWQIYLEYFELMDLFSREMRIYLEKCPEHR